MSRAEQPLARLLVSVRSVAEAASALRGGAGLIDVKEPSRGPLGRSDDETIVDVANFVAGRRPVSAALGELIDNHLPLPNARLDFVKWGLSGCRGRFDWQRALSDIIASRPAGKPGVVVVAYADWQLAEAPPVQEVATFARRWPGAVFMIDTFNKQPDKNGHKPHLLDWLSWARVRDLCRRCRDAGVRVALAGSLNHELILRLAPLTPDWFAVRGAVCPVGDRQASVDETLVRELVDLLVPTSVMLPAAD